jgi:hypothetical protein
MKGSFDVSDVKPRKPKKYIIANDYLFYALYSKIHNIDTTSMNQYNEINEKIKIAEELEKMKFKNKEIIMNNLVYEPLIIPETLNIICLFYKVNLCYINDKTYVAMYHNISSPNKIYMNSKGECLEDVDTNKLLEINLDKPLKSVSYYKLPELQEMSLKLNIDTTKKKKQELYDSIKMFLSNIYKIE